MKVQMNAGLLIETIKTAVQQHGATPFTEMFVRIGKTGPTYSINVIKAQQEGPEFRLILETDILPDLTRG